MSRLDREVSDALQRAQADDLDARAATPVVEPLPRSRGLRPLSFLSQPRPGIWSGIGAVITAIVGAAARASACCGTLLYLGMQRVADRPALAGPAAARATEALAWPPDHPRRFLARRLYRRMYRRWPRRRAPICSPRSAPAGIRPARVAGLEEAPTQPLGERSRATWSPRYRLTTSSTAAALARRRAGSRSICRRQSCGMCSPRRSNRPSRSRSPGHRSLLGSRVSQLP